MIDVLGPEKRRRRTTQEKIAIVQQSFEPGMTVSPLLPGDGGVSLVSRCLQVSRAQLHVILRRTDDWKDGRRSRHSDDTDVLLRIHHVIGELPTYGYRRYGRCFADRPNLMVCLLSMPNVFTGSCARMRCCLSENRCTAIETGTYWQSGRERKQSTMVL